MNIQELMNNAQKMPNIPEVVRELIQTFNDDDINSEDIANKIAKDQVLTAKVLRMANSSRYGGNRNVASVNDSVVLLGFNALRTMVLASGLTSAFKAPEGFDLNQFWANSFSVAGLCKWVAKYAKLDPEVAYTCGMMHSIGEILIHTLVPEQAAKVDSLANLGAQHERAKIEERELGFDFTLAGAELAEHWKFPEEIVTAIRYQLSPVVEGELDALAGIVFLANYLNSLNSGDTETVELTELTGFPRDIAQQLGIDIDAMMAGLADALAIDDGISDMLH